MEDDRWYCWCQSTPKNDEFNLIYCCKNEVSKINETAHQIVWG